ncbi:hydroxyethylthiazole kinase [Algivirga pacifica]|uniref:Hydroxyethylthiazole kinase n=1 Tax=Algivirga pacifica TaxID=1162670 RepID=A0ABP9DNW1_9BACT
MKNTSVIKKLKEQSPIVHNITNYVVMNNTANALLAIGASPIMAHAPQEMEDMVSISSSLVINMGTLSEKWVEAMVLAIKKAKETGTPCVFDPVGVGASKYRMETAKRIIEAATPEVIRGNASEIMALAQVTGSSKGVDSTMDSQDAIEAAKSLSKELNNTVVISGAVDYIITQDKVSEVEGGSPMMTRVTGMGCTSTSIVGACIAVEEDRHQAAVAAMELMSEAGSRTAAIAKGPGSFQMNFLDSLYQILQEA